MTGTLPERITALLLDYPGGLPAAEIADLLGSTLSNTRVHLSHMCQDHTVRATGGNGRGDPTIFQAAPKAPEEFRCSAQARAALRVLPSLSTKDYRHLAAAAGFSYPAARAIWSELQACGAVQ